VRLTAFTHGPFINAYTAENTGYHNLISFVNKKRSEHKGVVSRAQAANAIDLSGRGPLTRPLTSLAANLNNLSQSTARQVSSSSLLSVRREMM